MIFEKQVLVSDISSDIRGGALAGDKEKVLAPLDNNWLDFIHFVMRSYFLIFILILLLEIREVWSWKGIYFLFFES